MLIAAVVALAVIPSAARSDGDPASDVLPDRSVFYPYSPPVSASLARILNLETAATSRTHFPIKVALIASPADVGAIAQLFGRPQRYADFLDLELGYQARPPLLVVMPSGYGVAGLSPRATLALPSLTEPASSQSDDLARAAIVAVLKIAVATGHPIKQSFGHLPPTARTSGPKPAAQDQARGSPHTKSGDTPVPFALGMLALTVAVIATMRYTIRRHRVGALGR